MRRNTKNKEKILEVFKTKHSLTALELIQLLPKIDPTTIYRNLARFVEDGILRELDLQKEVTSYELVKDNDHHHHIICKKCKRVMEFHPTKKLEAQVRKMQKLISEKSGIEVSEHILDFRGLCTRCKARD
jgi:Fur family ferric uptake transcriptional regulator